MKILIMTTFLVLICFIQTSFAQIKEVPEKSMKKVKAEVYIDAPIEKVWKLVGENFDENSKFSVGSKSSSYLKKEEGILGSKRRTINYKDKVVDVEVVKYLPSEFHVKWNIFNMNAAPLKAGNASYSLREGKNGGTILTQNAAFKMKFFLMDLVAKKKFKSLFTTELAGVKYLAETGKNISEETKEQIITDYADSISILE